MTYRPRGEVEHRRIRNMTKPRSAVRVSLSKTTYHMRRRDSVRHPYVARETLEDPQETRRRYRPDGRQRDAGTFSSIRMVASAASVSRLHVANDASKTQSSAVKRHKRTLGMCINVCVLTARLQHHTKHTRAVCGI